VPHASASGNEALPELRRILTIGGRLHNGIRKCVIVGCKETGAVQDVISDRRPLAGLLPKQFGVNGELEMTILLELFWEFLAS
jgi:hypothetical protein